MFDLTLQNGYPSPYPENLSEAEQEEISENVTSLDITGVVNFQWLHTVTIEFADQASYDAAKLATGWTPWSELVLEAETSGPEGYAHPAILAGNKAYCGFMITPTAPASPTVEILIDVNEFKRRARAEAFKLYAYGELINDVDDYVDIWIAQGVDSDPEGDRSPEAFARHYGDKYDLRPREDW